LARCGALEEEKLRMIKQSRMQTFTKKEEKKGMDQIDNGKQRRRSPLANYSFHPGSIKKTCHTVAPLAQLLEGKNLFLRSRDKGKKGRPARQSRALARKNRKRRGKREMFTKGPGREGRKPPLLAKEAVSPEGERASKIADTPSKGPGKVWDGTMD